MSANFKIPSVARLERELEEAREKYADLVELLNDKAARLEAAEAAAEEARRREATLRDHATKQATDLAEARQERDRMYAENEHLETWRQKDETRIQTLEAALRECGSIAARAGWSTGPGSIRYIVIAALQPTTDHEAGA